MPRPPSTYRDGMRAILPLMAAVLAIGASFGVLARAAGVDALAALVMRATLLVVVVVAAATAAGLRAIA